MILNKKNHTLTTEQITYLRQLGLLKNFEAIYVVGDMIIAENIETSERRQIAKVSDVLNESKRVLLG